MSEIVKYKAVVNSPRDIEKAVQTFLNDGWELYGYPSVYQVNNMPKVLQAVVMRKEEPTANEEQNNDESTIPGEGGGS